MMRHSSSYMTGVQEDAVWRTAFGGGPFWAVLNKGRPLALLAAIGCKAFQSCRLKAECS